MTKEERIDFWIESSERDSRTMENLFQNKDYHWALFMGHLVVEKLLKACYTKHLDDQPPLIHNLLRLAEKINIELDEEQKDVLITVTTFNIRARYDDYKMEFFKTCTREFTTYWISRIKEFAGWINTHYLKS